MVPLDRRRLNAEWPFDDIIERDDKLDVNGSVFVPEFKAIIFDHPNHGCSGLAAAAALTFPIVRHKTTGKILYKRERARQKFVRSILTHRAMYTILDRGEHRKYKSRLKYTRTKIVFLILQCLNGHNHTVLLTKKLASAAQKNGRIEEG